LQKCIKFPYPQRARIWAKRSLLQVINKKTELRKEEHGNPHRECNVIEVKGKKKKKEKKRDDTSAPAQARTTELAGFFEAPLPSPAHPVPHPTELLTRGGSVIIQL